MRLSCAVLLLLVLGLPQLAGASMLFIEPIPLEALVDRSQVIVEVVVADPATTQHPVSSDDPDCPAMPQTRFAFEVLDVLKGGADAPVGEGWAIGANDGLMRAMGQGMCKGDPVPSPKVDGYETTATWKAGERLLLFLRRNPDGTLRMQVQDAFEVAARREDVARSLAAPPE